jgi:hypothetical protein
MCAQTHVHTLVYTGKLKRRGSYWRKVTNPGKMEVYTTLTVNTSVYGLIEEKAEEYINISNKTSTN